MKHENCALCLHRKMIHFNFAIVTFTGGSGLEAERLWGNMYVEQIRFSPALCDEQNEPLQRMERE